MLTKTVLVILLSMVYFLLFSSRIWCTNIGGILFSIDDFRNTSKGHRRHPEQLSSQRRLSECHKKFFEKDFRNCFRNKEGFKIISAVTESTDQWVSDQNLEIMVRMNERSLSSLSNPKPLRIIMWRVNFCFSFIVLNRKKYPVLRIRDVYPGAEFFHPGSASKSF
jgi:hypothetical protein